VVVVVVVAVVAVVVAVVVVPPTPRRGVGSGANDAGRPGAAARGQAVTC